VDLHATDLVKINGITRVLLVHTCQQGVYRRGHVLPLRLPINIYLHLLLVLKSKFFHQVFQPVLACIAYSFMPHVQPISGSLFERAVRIVKFFVT
jgi:hypothetical protein